MAVKDYSSVIKWSVIGIGLAIAAYIVYKVVKGTEWVGQEFDKFQHSLVEDPNEYTELADFEQAIDDHGACIYYDISYEGAWALFGLGAIVTKCETKKELIDTLQATQDTFPDENKVNICWMKHEDGFRTFLGNGNQVLNYQIDLPLTQQELIASLNPEHTDPAPVIEPWFTIQPVIPYVEPITLIDGSEYTPVSAASTQEVYEQNLIIAAEREAALQEMIDAGLTPEQIHISDKLEIMQPPPSEPIFTIQPVISPGIEPIQYIAPTTYEEYRSSKLEMI